MKYDLVVVGGGPAGLMAAKTVAENNLEVVLVDVKKEISKINRTCGMMLHMTPGLHGINLVVEPGKLVFKNNNFSINYTGDLYDLYYKYYFSPSGYKYCTVNKNPCLGKVIDKGELLRGLLEEIEKLGVKVHTETMGLKAENTNDGVRVQVRSKGQLSSVEGKMAVAADGCNSRITESLGLNETRKKLRSVKYLHYIMEGVECPYENSYFFFRGSTYSPARYINAIPRASGNDVIYFHDETEERNKYFLTKSPVADWFKNAKIVQKGSDNRTTYTPIMEPVLGNILIVGDAAGSLEVEIHGALACGYRAGLSVTKAVKEKKGLKEYVDWWQNSIEYVKNPESAQTSVYRPDARSRPEDKKVSFVMYFTEEEVDYLFSLIDNEMFPGVMNPFKGFDATVDAFLKHQNIIQKEKPALLKKIEEWIGMSPKEFKASRSAFSYTIIR